MNELAFVTCIYSNLADGSLSRRDRYYTSLKNMLGMEVPFVVYCDREEMASIKAYTGERWNLTLIPFDLNTVLHHDDWSVLRTMYKHGGRCMELVHNKIHWLNSASEVVRAKRYYWIDAGLSFFSLWPHRHIRNQSHPGFEKYTDIDVFVPSFVTKLLSKSNDDKIYAIGLSSLICLWSQPLAHELYNGKIEHRGRVHLIGGLFGGTSENLKWMAAEYEKELRPAMDYFIARKPDPTVNLPVEELIMNLVYCKNDYRFKLDIFDTWYHENHEPCFDPYKKGISFHKLFV